MIRRALALSLMLLFSAPQAAELFTLDFTVNGEKKTRNYDTANATFKGTSEDFIKLDFPNYNPYSDAVSIQLGYLGVGALLDFAQNSTDLRLQIPSLGIDKTFTGPTRDDAVLAMQAFFTSNGSEELNRVLAAINASSPVAAQPQLIQQQTNSAFDDSLSSQSFVAPSGGDSKSSSGGDGAASAAAFNSTGLGLAFGNIKYGEFRTKSLTVPLSYTIRNELDPRRQLVLSLPVTQTSVNTAKTWSVTPGISYSWPMNERWTLIPSLKYGITYSKDLNQAGQVLSGALTSTYAVSMSDSHVLVIANMYGRSNSLKFEANDVEVDANLKLNAFRNGVMYSQPVNLWGKNLAVEYTLINTVFTGSEVFVKRYNEVGVTIGTNRKARTSRDYIRGGIRYTFSSEAKGATFNFGYWF
ncbi:hypothetical protein [Chitinimonas sp. BJYL2]|uniref:hypothetical protein n=1 Tax=Chitinimonas sp. BJYL2 TaxID=2976696 RepID=UPI0022B2DF93|nr:hypothetical protein [Chitinimonas sp. BJYL2]